MTDYTLSEAARETGASRSAIHRAIKSGRLSARKIEDGSLRIDGAELARVYPPASRDVPDTPSPWNAARQADMPRDAPRDAPGDEAGEVRALRVEVEELRARLAREEEMHEATREDARATIADLRRRLDGATEVAHGHVRALLPPPEARPAAPVPAPPDGQSRDVHVPAPIPPHPRSRISRAVAALRGRDA